MALKPVRLIYQSRISATGVPTTGLTNVKAQIYIDGVAKAVGSNAIALTEIDATNAPGLYEGVISASALTGYGAAAGQNLEANINSATANAPAIFRQVLTAIATDDLDSHLTTQDTAIAAVKTDTVAIRTDLETAASSLPNIFAAINTIQNNAGFALGIPATMLKPGSGSNTYRLTEYVYNEKNMLVDPDSNTVTVRVVNQAGADRSSYLVGYVAGSNGANGTAPAVRDAAGKYHIDIAIPSTAAQEQLNFEFAYAVGGSSTARTGTSEIITDVQADGFAQQATVLDIQTRVTDTQSKVNDSTIGLAAANTLQTSIKTALTALQSDVTTNVEGAGFVSSSDSLHAISLFLQTNLSSGGKAV